MWSPRPQHPWSSPSLTQLIIPRQIIVSPHTTHQLEGTQQGHLGIRAPMHQHLHFAMSLWRENYGLHRIHTIVLETGLHAETDQTKHSRFFFV